MKILLNTITPKMTGKNKMRTATTTSSSSSPVLSPLRKARKQHKLKAHQSIIAFMKHSEAADRCTKNHFLIDYRIKAAKYVPHLFITECYKGYRYGHTASSSANKERCGNCSHDHSTTACTSDQPKCISCQKRGVSGSTAEQPRHIQSIYFRLTLRSNRLHIPNSTPTSNRL